MGSSARPTMAWPGRTSRARTAGRTGRTPDSPWSGRSPTEATGPTRFGSWRTQRTGRGSSEASTSAFNRNRRPRTPRSPVRDLRRCELPFVHVPVGEAVDATGRRPLQVRLIGQHADVEIRVVGGKLLAVELHHLDDPLVALASLEGCAVQIEEAIVFRVRPPATVSADPAVGGRADLSAGVNLK